MKKIGIVGHNIDPEILVGFENDYQLWGVNNLFLIFEGVKFGKWFDIHDIYVDRGDYVRRGYRYYPIGSETSVNEYLCRLDNLSCPIFLKKPLDIIKNYEIFPFENLIAEYGEYFGCSFAWMTAYAISIGAEEIGYFGTKLVGHEYYYQKPSTEYLMGIAKGKKIKIFNHETSNLLRNDYIYAYKENFDIIYFLHGTLSHEIVENMYTCIQEKVTDIYNHFNKKIIDEDIK